MTPSCDLNYRNENKLSNKIFSVLVIGGRDLGPKAAAAVLACVAVAGDGLQAFLLDGQEIDLGEFG